NLRDSVDRAIRIFAEEAETKGLELSYSVSPDLPDRVNGDSYRLRQVLINLVGNAVKFTEQGEIHVECRLNRLDEDDAIIGFTVRDTGPGIPADECADIFESFAQADPSMGRRYGGTGLGLSISRHLVGLMQGEIGVDSEVGNGSTFWFTVRLAVCEGVTEGSMIRRLEPTGLRLLLVDDSETVRQTLR
ncbi:MAG: ATP-binding protein, partial [Verrucomicrobiota bacterium]|nr:ATP-binding protein [Verrucomicrobiota bacterium]